MSLPQMLADLPRACDVGTKRNAKGHTTSWIGYKIPWALEEAGRSGFVLAFPRRKRRREQCPEKFEQPGYSRAGR